MTLPELKALIDRHGQDATMAEVEQREAVRKLAQEGAFAIVSEDIARAVNDMAEQSGLPAGLQQDRM